VALTRSAPPGDVRLDLAAEVQNRLNQLDLILEKLAAELRVFRGNPEEIDRMLTFGSENVERLRSGQISQDEFVRGTSRPPMTREEGREWKKAADSIGLFTETFYFIAWRLIEALNQNQPQLRFPELERVKGRHVLVVRNHLLQHPEKFGLNLKQGVVITDDGPVLRSQEIVFRADGSVASSDDTVDVGLYVAADELRAELEAKFAKAASLLAA
jgi:hypothetical protein